MYTDSTLMKYLGIDYGTKRVGIALSDEGGVLAFPRTVLKNTTALVHQIVELSRAEHIGAIIVGESRNFQNAPNPVMRKILPFAEELKKASGLPVIFVPEMLSSQEARRIQGDTKGNDASAAAIVLQSYLDRINPARSPEEETQ